MKKTLVAVAALAAVTGAMAEVTISGFVDQAYNTVRSTTGANGRVAGGTAGVTTTRSSLGSNAIGQDALQFGVSEDIGNGITATANINFVGSITNPGTVSTDAGSGVGLKGSFGAFSLGQGYTYIWKTSNSSDASGWGAGVGNVHGVGAGGNGNGIGYTLPEFAPGLTVGVEKGLGQVDGTRNGNYDGWGVNYTVGAFMASYSGGRYQARGTAQSAAATAAQAAVNAAGGVANAAYGAAEWVTSASVGTVAATDEALNAGARSRITAIAVSYDFGMIKLYGGYNSNNSGGNTNQTANSSTYGLKIPLGSFNVGIAQSAANYRNAAGNSSTANGTRLLTTYSFTKRTQAYFQYGIAKIDSGANTQNSGASASGTGFGLTHSF